MFKTRDPLEHHRAHIVAALDAIWDQVRAMENGKTPYDQDVLDALVEQSRLLAGDIPVIYKIIRQNAHELKKAHNRNYLQEIKVVHEQIMQIMAGQHYYSPEDLAAFVKQAEQITADCPENAQVTLYLESIQHNVSFLERFYALVHPVVPVAAEGVE